jgi:hypothetical protein
VREGELQLFTALGPGYCFSAATDASPARRPHLAGYGAGRPSSCGCARAASVEEKGGEACPAPSRLRDRIGSMICGRFLLLPRAGNGRPRPIQLTQVGQARLGAQWPRVAHRRQFPAGWPSPGLPQCLEPSAARPRERDFSASSHSRSGHRPTRRACLTRSCARTRRGAGTTTERQSPSPLAPHRVKRASAVPGSPARVLLRDER